MEDDLVRTWLVGLLTCALLKSSYNLTPGGFLAHTKRGPGRGDRTATKFNRACILLRFSVPVFILFICASPP